MKTKKKVVKKATKKVAKKTLKQLIAQDKKVLQEFCTPKCFKEIHTIEEQLYSLFSNPEVQKAIKDKVLDGTMAGTTQSGALKVTLIFNNDNTLIKDFRNEEIKKKITDFLDYLESKMKR